jgi:hypothetical protein
LCIILFTFFVKHLLGKALKLTKKENKEREYDIAYPYLLDVKATTNSGRIKKSKIEAKKARPTV